MSALLRKRRFIWIVGLCLFTLLGVGGYVSGQRYVLASQWVTHTFEVTANVDRIVSDIQDIEGAQRGFLLTGDAAFLDSYERDNLEVQPALRKLEALVHDNHTQRRRLTDLRRLIEAKVGFCAETIEMRRRGEDFVGLVRTGRGKHLMDGIREVASEMRSEERRLLVERAESAAGAQQRTIVFSLIGMTLVLGLALFSLTTAQRDVHELTVLSEELLVAEKKFRELAENASDLVLLVDTAARAHYVSPSVKRLLGYQPEEFVAAGAESIVPEPDWTEARAWVNSLIATHTKIGRKNLRYRRKDGVLRWFEVSASILRDGAGASPTILLSARDVHDQRLAHEALQERAEALETLSETDGLTGLLNRRGFMDRALGIMETARSRHQPLGLVFVDLDGLKPINDQLGHDVGDRAIAEAARLLRSTCRGGDLVSRLGGDEFAVLARDLTPEGYVRFRQRVEQALETANGRGERPFQLSFSIGAAFFEAASDETLESLLRRADAIMYEEKKKRKKAVLGSPLGEVGSLSGKLG